MHALIELAIRRPVGVSVAVALVALFGVLAVTGIPIQLTPDIALPRISVGTAWPGASPEEVEKELLEVQEEALRGVPGVARFESNARPSWGSITMEFRVGQDMTEALLAVSNRLSQIPRYPENVQEPLIEAADAREFVDEALQGLRRRMIDRVLAPLLAAVQRRYRQTAHEGVDRLFRKELSGLGDTERAAVRRWAETLARRFAHLPTTGLRGLAYSVGPSAVEAFLEPADKTMVALLREAANEPDAFTLSEGHHEI